MVTRRKFAEISKQPSQAHAVSVTRSGPEATEPKAPDEAVRGSFRRRRRAGKRSDPAFRPTTIFVRKETQRKATRLLEDQDTGKDFSDLVEELVADWISRHSHA